MAYAHQDERNLQKTLTHLASAGLKTGDLFPLLHSHSPDQFAFTLQRAFQSAGYKLSSAPGPIAFKRETVAYWAGWRTKHGSTTYFWNGAHGVLDIQSEPGSFRTVLSPADLVAAVVADWPAWPTLSTSQLRVTYETFAPADPLAQRELAWVLLYKYRTSIEIAALLSGLERHPWVRGFQEHTWMRMKLGTAQKPAIVGRFHGELLNAKGDTVQESPADTIVGLTSRTQAMKQLDGDYERLTNYWPNNFRTNYPDMPWLQAFNKALTSDKRKGGSITEYGFLRLTLGLMRHGLL